MNRFLEIAALSAGGLSLCLVGYAACAKVTGHGEDDVRDFGRWLAGTRGASTSRERPVAESVPSVATSTVTVAATNAATDSAANPAPKIAPRPAPVQASLGILSAWTLPSPYSSEELGTLAQELTNKRAELDEHRRLVAKRSAALEHDERTLEERLKTLEELRTRLEALRDELTQRELDLLERERPAAAGHWTEIAGVLEAFEEPAAAAQKLQEFEPDDAARILAAFVDAEQASLVLNAVAPERWKEYVAAYSAERASKHTGRGAP